MFKDNNVPDGSYKDHYNKMTGATSFTATRAPQRFTNWEVEAIDNLLTHKTGHYEITTYSFTGSEE
jgi:hypothetical protein